MNFLKLPLWVAGICASISLYAQAPMPSMLTMIDVGALIRADVYQHNSSTSPQANVADIYSAPLPPISFVVRDNVLGGLNLSNNSQNLVSSGTQTVEHGWSNEIAGQATVTVGYVAAEASYSTTVNKTSGYTIAWNSHNSVSYTTEVDSDGFVTIRYVVKYSIVTWTRYGTSTLAMQQEGQVHTGLSLNGIQLMQNNNPSTTPPVIESPVTPAESPVSSSGTAGNGVYVSGTELGYVPVTPSDPETYTEVGPLIFVAYVPESPVSAPSPVSPSPATSWWGSFWDWLFGQ